MASLLTKAYWNAFILWLARDEHRLPYRPLEEILAIQSRRVRAIVAHAYATVPYYREVMDQAGLEPSDFQTADDLAKLPILTGEQIVAQPERFLSRQYAVERCIRMYSGGTMGIPKLVYYTPSALFLSLACGQRQRYVLAHFVGRTFGYREMGAERGDGTSAKLRQFYETHSWVPKHLDIQRQRLRVEEPFEANIAQINDFRPDVLFGWGSYLGALFRRAREMKLPLFRPKVVWYGADKMMETDRALIENEFGVPVYSTYQATEALRIAFQCEQREAFHINLDLVAVRVVDDHGHTLGPGGTGHILISNLTNRATVLLNYKLGDVVTLGTSPCPCGRTLPTITRIEGRSDDLVVRPGGQMLLPAFFRPHILSVPGVVQMQLIQEELQRFRLKLVGAGGVDKEQAGHQVEAILRSTIGPDITLTIEWVESIPREPGGKFRSVISHCRE